MTCEAGSILGFWLFHTDAAWSILPVLKTWQVAGAALILRLSREGLRDFQGSQGVKHLSATGCSKNNCPAWDVYDPHFLVLGMRHAFGRHRNGQ